MPDFNRTELSALPINVAINTLIEEGARVDPEKNFEAISGQASSEISACVGFNMTGCATPNIHYDCATFSTEDIFSRHSHASVSFRRASNSPRPIN